GRATKDQHADLQATLVVVDFFDDAIEIGKRAVYYTHRLSRLEQCLRPRLVTAVSHAAQDGVGFFLSDRCRLLLGTTDEAHHTGRLVDQVPSTVIHLHLDQHIAG